MTTLSLTIDFLESALTNWDKNKPLVLGISGPQGSGKLYLAENVLTYLSTNFSDLRAIGVLTDDFYLTHEEQVKVSLAAKEEGNTILQGRGLPGTHDLQLALETLDNLVSKRPCKVPLYDKSAYGGEGDRLAESKWRSAEKPVDVVVFEGWFNGFRSIDPNEFTKIYMVEPDSGVVKRSTLHHLEEVNHKLKEYEPLWSYIDYFVYLETDNIDNVYLWRLEQESALIAATASGMDEHAVRKFVDRYMPMYYLYYWRMCRDGVVEGKNLCLKIDLARRVIASEVK